MPCRGRGAQLGCSGERGLPALGLRMCWAGGRVLTTKLSQHLSGIVGVLLEETAVELEEAK